MSFTTEVAREGARWVAYVTVAGWGRRVSASATNGQRAYRFTTQHPYDHGRTAQQSEGYQEMLVRPRETISDQINLRQGQTRLGGFGFELLDLPIRELGGTSHGWQATDLITDMLAVEGPHHSTHNAAKGRWKISADVDMNDTIVEVDSNTGLAIGDILHCGAEAMMVVNPAHAAGQIEVARESLGTRAQRHRTTGHGGAGWLYDRPRYVKGRRIELWVTLHRKLTDEIPAEGSADHIRLWTGRITDWELSDDFNSFRFMCSTMLNRLDRNIAREQFNGTIDFVNDGLGAALADQTADNPLIVVLGTIENADIGPVPVDLDYPEALGAREFYARLGDGICRCRAESVGGKPYVYVFASGLLQSSTEIQKPSNDGGIVFRDILVALASDQRDLNPDGVHSFTDSDGNAVTSPVDIALMLCTSTGYIVDGGPQNGSHDRLPESWGAGADVDDFDLDSWREVRALSPVRMPRLVLGWQGKPFPLRKWLEDNILGPLGMFLYPTSEGKIAIGTIGTIYPGQATTTIVEADLELSGPRMKGDLGRTVTWQTWGVDWDFAEGKPRHLIRVCHAQARERGEPDNSDIETNVPGLGSGQASMSVLSGRLDQYAHWFVTPLPVIQVTVGMHKVQVDLTEPVRLTCSTLPNPFTGTRGLTNASAVVVGRSLNFETNCLDLELLLMPTLNCGLWAPAGVVREWSETTRTMRLEPNQYSDSINAGGQVPARDVLGFTVGDIMMVCSPTGDVLSVGGMVSTVVVNAIEPSGLDTIRFATVFNGYKPTPGDRLMYCHWDTGGWPHGSWDSDMDDHVAQADGTADNELPDGEPAYVYGS